MLDSIVTVNSMAQAIQIRNNVRQKMKDFDDLNTPTYEQLVGATRIRESECGFTIQVHGVTHRELENLAKKIGDVV